ncbi:AAA family ATPase, partial [Microcoleus sp. D3_18a_C4]|uniref:AAA family ATPase n=1 Tax=Microcoleus sp. D3_18a_C4 TaxID=3055332 RepID=UPI002FCF237D
MDITSSQVINREEVRQQLAALGYKAGDVVYLRAFFADSDPRKKDDLGRKADATNLDQVIAHATKFQAEGRGIYLVVNGGGHKNEDVTFGRAIFYEHDNLGKDAQIELWKGLGLPEPSFQVDTGGKSIHSYWVLAAALAIEKWLELQKDLLNFADADRSIKNASRVMRLAGAWHSSGNQSLIITNSGRRYEYEELRAIVPTPEKPEPTLFQQKPQPQAFYTSEKPDSYEAIRVPVPMPVPLLCSLGKENKSLLQGVATQRNTSMATLARDLIGTANDFAKLGQSTSDDAYTLFIDACRRCSPGGCWGEKEWEGIWKSAEGSNPSASISKASPDAVENCIKSWYWQEFGDKERSKRSNHKPQNSTKLSMLEAANQAREILRSERDELTTNIKLEEVRHSAGMGEYAWEHKIIRPIKKDLDLQRYKSELLYIMAIADPVERDWRIAQIAPKYQLQRAVIERNIVQMKERTTTPESQLWSLSEVFNLQSEGLQWIIPELLPCGETVILSASPKVGKSLIAVDLAFCTATGEEKFLGQNIKMGKVLLVSVDESLNSTRSKLLKRGFRLQDNDNIKVLPQWDITQTAKLETFLEDYRPDVVIIDSLKRICKGSTISENSAEFSDNIYALKELFTRYGAAGVLIHHSNKNADALGVDRLRGSSAIAGSVWGVWQVDHIPKKDPNNSKKLIIDPKDPKRIFSCFPRDAEGQTLDIELNLENNSWICHGLAGEEAEAAQQRETIRERILRALEKHNRPLSGPEIIETTELTEKRGSVYSELNRMVGKKVISAAPAPGNKRFTLYSLPHIQAEKSPPPPPPPISLPNAIYESENLIEHGFQIDSSIDSRYIAIDSTVTVESEMLSTANDCENRVSEIDSKLPLSQRGGEVKCAFATETVTEKNVELSHQIQ